MTTTAKTRIEPYKQDAFNWEPYARQHSKASLGKCSSCWQLRPAVYMLVSNETNRPMRALCTHHRNLYYLRVQLEDVRQSIYFDNERSSYGPDNIRQIS